MRIATALLSAALTLGAAPLAASDRMVVVELFTSQGCSSCPPADALLAQVAQRQDVIALALHVDYWDYIGWADMFAQPAFTKRQKAYAAAAGERMVYTPQIIVGGIDHVVGYQPIEVTQLIEKHGALPDRVALDLTRENGRIAITAEAVGPLPQVMAVQLVAVSPGREVAIDHGENAGKRIFYSNIVEGWHRLAEWNGAAPLSIEVEDTMPGRKIAVLIQERGPGAIIAAAMRD
ncbi:DUF1223 domain-containing protein [Profundibacterium mesophilum]|uniref:Secreted protein n=1 Tax=Profundibacterium mesophilum KAUST100406-0324 TaxID=1037889 RepID=A0A921NST7_9RHOB|nr:DUF1223 domain-containing protein [Profundibacterium mesophilum]KAF0674808.1 putative secreted protein [Profundibacterium mesophilum KAUST100406-0324]